MSDKVRVYEIADEAGSNSALVIEKAKDLNIDLKSAQSAVTIEEAEEITKYIMTGKSSRLQKKAPKVKRVVKKEDSAAEKKVEEEIIEQKTETVEVVENKSVIEDKKPAKQKRKIQKIRKVEIKKPNELKNVLDEKTAKEIVKDDKKEEKLEISEQKEKAVEETKKIEKVEILKTVEEEKSTEKVIEKKEEIKTEPVEKKTNKIIPKRRGLKIVKKNRPKVEERNVVLNTSNINGKKTMKSLSEILGGGNDHVGTDAASIAAKKQKIRREKRRSSATKIDHGKRLDVQRGYDEFGTSNDSLLGEEVVMLDIDMRDNIKMLEEQKPANNTNKHTRSSRPAEFGNAPRGLRRRKARKRVKSVTVEKVITSVEIPEDIRVYEFAEACGKTTSEVITILFGLGMMVTKNDFLKQDELEILGEELEIEVTVKDALEDANYVDDYNDEEVNETHLVERPPVVTIMGHVDHGKTTLLDKIRSSKVADKEVGGITQHISSYTIEKSGKEITFVDTPGHAAFSEMRVRGANVTDIIIIVVAADDGVKPQTEEVISHSKASGCPIIVAVNKIDKEAANIDMVKAQMAEKGLTPVDWGGDTEFIPVSAKKGLGIEDLLETILLQSEILELKADPSVKAKAVVVEAALEKGRGPVATVIVQNGTLKVGDNVVCDTTYGRVKAITNDLGKPVKQLTLSQTGNILGLNSIPLSGSSMVAQDSDKEAKEIANKRAEHARAKELSKSTKVSLEEMSGLIAEGKIKQLPVILKTDVAGSLEAIKGSLEKIANSEVKVKIIHSGVGGITESDLILASASEGCVILGFNVRPTGTVKNKAKADGITINTYSIIYDLIDDVKEALSGMMSAVVREENTGQAEVRDAFVIPKVGTVAGCMVTDGKVIRGGHARVIRDGVVAYTGKISSLKRFKDDVKEVGNGYECGIMFEKFNEIKVGDFIETFIQIEEKAKIEA